MNNEYLLHSKGNNWFHFRSNEGSTIESFSITYCHDGTVCMTGDMGCLTWQREYFPKTPDYGFPFDGTGIDYFAEKIVRADGLQVIKSWSSELAISDIKEAMQEDRDPDDLEALSYVFLCLEGFESGEYGYFQMLEEFNNLTHNIEGEEWCEYGRGYSEPFRMRFELLKSVSNIILDSVAGKKQIVELEEFPEVVV